MSELQPLSKVCVTITDGTHYTPKDVGNGIPFLTVKDMTPSGLDFQNCSQISRDDFLIAKQGNSAPKAGDVLFSKDGTVGKVQLVTSDNEFAVLSSIAILRPDSTQLYAPYLAHALKSEGILNSALKKKTGSAIRRIILSDLKTISIPLPPLAEQQRIAAILDKAEEIKRKREQAIAKLDELAQSTFVEMFGDPVENNKGWEIIKLERIASVGSSKRVFVEELTEAGVPFYRGTEIGALATGQTIEPSLFISKTHYERLKLESGVPKKGDLLLPSICHDGRIYLLEDENQFYFKDGRVLWIGLSRNEVNSYFLRELLKGVFAKNYSKIASGTTFAELKIFALKELDIISPPTMLQTKYGDFVRRLKAKHKKLDEDLRKVKELIASLQHQAFTTGFNA